SSLRFSVDQYHLDYIPLDRVHTAAQAAHDLDLEVFIEVGVGRRDYRAYKAVHSLKALPVKLKVSQILPFGRAAKLPEATFFTESFYRVANTPCIYAGVPVVETDGRVLLCCAFPVSQDPDDLESPFVLGHMSKEPLSKILARHLHNPMLRVLRYE